MKQTAVEWFYNELKNLIKESELTEMKRWCYAMWRFQGTKFQFTINV